MIKLPGALHELKIVITGAISDFYMYRNLPVKMLPVFHSMPDKVIGTEILQYTVKDGDRCRTFKITISEEED